MSKTIRQLLVSHQPLMNMACLCGGARWSAEHQADALKAAGFVVDTPLLPGQEAHTTEEVVAGRLKEDDGAQQRYESVLPDRAERVVISGERHAPFCNVIHMPGVTPCKTVTRLPAVCEKCGRSKGQCPHDSESECDCCWCYREDRGA